MNGHIRPLFSAGPVALSILIGCTGGDMDSATDNSTDSDSPEAPAGLRLDPDGNYLTMMSVWTPNEGVTVEELADAVATGIENDIRYADGFEGGAIHRSLDESNVIVYGRWQDQAALEAVVPAIEAGEMPNFSAALALASYESHPYRLDSLVGEIRMEVGQTLLTMVNTWSPLDGVAVDEVATALSAGIAADTSVQAGFQAAGVFASLDESNVRAYGHWTDQAALEAYGGVIEAGGASTFASVFALAASEAHPYEVVSVVQP